MAGLIKKLLIANRGEIVLRIARTARRMGISVATVHSDADRDAMHVREVGESIRIGAAPSSQSYLNIDAILKAARMVGADAIHPGIGFLSEDPNFAAQVESAGLIFVGPRPETMLRFADKWSAKHEARQANVSIIGGSEGSSDNAADVAEMIRKDMRLPVMLKAAAGGGGRGVRVVRTLDGLDSIVESAMREAQSSFGRPDVIVEEFVENARHLEVQVVGDGEGGVIHLFERECSLQRRFQKVIEEAPSINLPDGVRERLLTDAVNLARSVNYRNVGTMEFLVAGDRHYFLECNPRLQVEHTVTEEATGIDLVELQLLIASGAGLPLAQSDVVVSGHSIQARVYAENAAAGFIPSTGPLVHVAFPPNVRIETAVETGSEITPHYDAMIAKVISRGADRTEALDRLVSALNDAVIFGVETNLDFLKRLLAEPIVRQGIADNRFIDTQFVLAPPVAPVDRIWGGVAAALVLTLRNSKPEPALGLWGGQGDFLAWRYAQAATDAVGSPDFSLSVDDEVWPVAIGAQTAGRLRLDVGGEGFDVRVVGLGASRYLFEIDGRMVVVTAHLEGDTLSLQDVQGRPFRFGIVPLLTLEAASAVQSGQVRAPMMGIVTKIKVAAGDVVKKGDGLVVQESMKMEMSLDAPCDGVVRALNCSEGQMVERHDILVDVAADDAEPGQEPSR